MPAFLTGEFWDLTNPELWAAVGLLILIGILIWAGAIKAALGMLDAKSALIQSNLDEAAQIRAEAEAMLVGIHRQREEAEVQAKAMIAAAKDEAVRLAAEAKTRLEESIVRRAALAERKIEAAQAEAAAQVKAAAVDMAARAAEVVMAGQLAASKTDAQVDKAIGELASKLQ